MVDQAASVSSQRDIAIIAQRLIAGNKADCPASPGGTAESFDSQSSLTGLRQFFMRSQRSIAGLLSSVPPGQNA